MSIAEKFEVIADEVYEKGKEKERSDFWENFQVNGNRTDYRYAFAYNGWNENNFYPKYDIAPTANYGEYMFAGLSAFRDFDLAQRLKDLNVTIDLSGLTSSSHEFYLARFGNLPTLDFSGCTTMERTFDYCTITNLSLILSDDGGTTFTSPFRRCSYLKGTVRTFRCTCMG